MEKLSNQYVPGYCNIGKEEVDKRRKLLGVAALAVILFMYFSLAHSESTWMKIFLFFSVSVFVAILIEVRKRFCVAFGIFGRYNFGKLGKTQKIADKNAQVEDRKNVIKIILVSIASGLLFTLFIHLIFSLLH